MRQKMKLIGGGRVVRAVAGLHDQRYKPLNEWVCVYAVTLTGKLNRAQGEDEDGRIKNYLLGTKGWVSGWTAILPCTACAEKKCQVIGQNLLVVFSNCLFLSSTEISWRACTSSSFLLFRLLVSKFSNLFFCASNLIRSAKAFLLSVFKRRMSSFSWSTSCWSLGNKFQLNEIEMSDLF